MENSIDLSKCKKGDILISSHGAILEYVAPTPWKHYRYLDHVVRYVEDENGNPYNEDNYGTRTNDGFVFRKNRKPSIDHDIVEIKHMNNPNDNPNDDEQLIFLKVNLNEGYLENKGESIDNKFYFQDKEFKKFLQNCINTKSLNFSNSLLILTEKDLRLEYKNIDIHSINLYHHFNIPKKVINKSSVIIFKNKDDIKVLKKRF